MMTTPFKEVEPISLLRTQLVTSVQREEQNDDGTIYVLGYDLWRDDFEEEQTFYYIKCYLRTIHRGILTKVDLEIADGLGADESLAEMVFSRITSSPHPPFPVHIKDIVRDSVAEYSTDLQEAELAACGT